MRTIALAAIWVVLAACATSPAPQPADAAAPAWWRAHVAYMSEGGGQWRTPNPDASAAPNAQHEFGMEWRSVNDGRGLVGRLFGIEDGREMQEYWTFREFWHPGERRAILQQWGGPGVFGAGETLTLAPDRGQVDQTFWLPDGRSWREGHRTHEGADAYATEVYDIDAAGVWTLRTTNVWRRF